MNCANQVLKKLLPGLLSVATLAACAPGLMAIERQLVFWPQRQLRETPADYGFDYEPFVVTTEDGLMLEGWHIPGQPDDPWLIYFHGNADTISGSLTLPLALKSYLPLNILMAEYRGYLRNEGTPSEAGLYRDGQAYYEAVRSRGVAAENLILFGFSLGTGVATQLAAENHAGLLVLQAPYASIPDTARWRYGDIPEGMLSIQFDNLSKMEKIDIPLFIMHGSNDRSIPLEQAQQLYERATAPKTIVAFDGGHNTINTPAIANYDWLLRQLEHFIRSHLEHFAKE